MFEKKFHRFLFVGFMNTIIGYAIFVVLVISGIYYIVALAMSYGVGIINSYIWNRRWTFKSNKKKIYEFPRFVVISFITYISNLLLLTILIEKLMLNMLVGQAITISIVVAINFACHKNWSFKNHAIHKETKLMEK